MLIDVGSFLRNYENHEFALVVSKYYNDCNIVYFDINDKPVAMLNGESVQFDMKKLKRDLKTKVIFDQKHTIGTDHDLHSLSKSIITVSNTTAETPLVQGIFRLREIDINQEITYLTKDMDIINTNDLIKHVEIMEKNIYKSSKIKFCEQSILCLLRRYHKYSKESYQIKTFIPSSDMLDSIFGNYEHNYKNEAFKKYVNDFMKPSTETENDVEIKISVEIQKYLDKIEKLEKLHIDDKSIMIQKNTDQEQTHQREMEINKNKSDNISCELNYSTVPNYDIYTNPESSNANINIPKSIVNEPMISILISKKINMSPDAIKSICKIYENGECKDLFYLAFIGSGDKLKVWLYTSVDLIILFSLNPALNLVCVDKFSTDVSDDKFFYQNFMMFMSLKIPDGDTIDAIKEVDDIKAITRSIRMHYKNVFKYTIGDISKRFADFLEEIIA